MKNSTLRKLKAKNMLSLIQEVIQEQSRGGTMGMKPQMTNPACANINSPQELKRAAAKIPQSQKMDIISQFMGGLTPEQQTQKYQTLLSQLSPRMRAMVPSNRMMEQRMSNVPRPRPGEGDQRLIHWGFAFMVFMFFFCRFHEIENW